VSLIAVLIPLLFMGDVVGRLFREFAITLAVAILISALVSLTLTPMMCAKFLRHVPERSRAVLPRERRILRARDPPLRRDARLGARAPARHALGGAGTLVLTVLLYIFIPKGFFPVQDTGLIQGISEARSRFPFRPWPSASRRSRAPVLESPAVESLSSYIGVDGVNVTLNSGRMLINLKPLSERDASAVDGDPPPAGAAEEGRGITLYMQPVQDLTIEDRVSRTQYQFTVEDAEPGRARALGAEAGRTAAAECRSWPDVVSDQQDQGLQAYVDIDRATASRLASPPAPSTTRSTTPSASGSSPPSSRRPASSAWCWRCRPIRAAGSTPWTTCT
jgi:multidrug efflux pump